MRFQLWRQYIADPECASSWDALTQLRISTPQASENGVCSHIVVNAYPVSSCLLKQRLSLENLWWPVVSLLVVLPLVPGNCLGEWLAYVARRFG